MKLALKIMFSFGEIKLENEKKYGRTKKIFQLNSNHISNDALNIGCRCKENGIKIGNFMRP